MIPLLLVTMATAVSAQGTKVAFGAIKLDTSLPIEVTSDELAVNQAEGTAIFSGNVVVGQGEMRLSAPRVMIVYTEDTKGIDRMEATGGVTLVSGSDAAEADRADYSIDDSTIVMTGNVLLKQPGSTLSSDKMTVQLNPGTAQMSGRVRTILQSGD